MVINAKTAILIIGGLLLAGCGRNELSTAGEIKPSPNPSVLTNLPPQIHAFILQKEQLAQTLAKKLGVDVDRSTRDYFRFAGAGDYAKASAIYQELREHGGKVESSNFSDQIPLPLWDPLLEVQLTLDAYASGAGRFATLFGQRIAESIPPGSIYFGGTDTGRGLPGAFAPITNGVPAFCVLTQNQLIDTQHESYLRAVFGGRINCLTVREVAEGFESYLEDAAKRFRHDRDHPGEPRQLLPGEDVSFPGNRIQVSGQAAMMMLNGRLAKMLFDKNPDRDFYVEESFPIEWMYPFLVPHGLIMKLGHQPVDELPPDVIVRNRKLWNELQAEFIGRWLTPDTTEKELCDFAERVFLRKDLTGFEGDPEFVRNRYSMAAFSKLRVAQAGLFEWRAKHTKSESERERMFHEAGIAAKQAFAFCPSNPEIVFRLADICAQTGRMDDARLVAHTARRIEPDNEHFADLEDKLK